MNNNYQKEAIKKLNNDKYKGSYVMVTDAVRDALIEFCYQDEEFAQAVVQSDKGLGECIETVLKGHGSCISDLEVYRKAVEFYFPGATVSMILKIHVNPYDANPQSSASSLRGTPNDAKEEKSKPASVIELDLDDLI